jgi:hypothetical protein
MGVVWRATDVELRRTVALKKSQSQDERQIQGEARIGAGLAHPNVVTVFDSVLDAGERWLVMEYLDARNLAEVLREDGPLPVPTVRRIGWQLADAVAAMHAKGMVHRDIKPSNVLVTADGTAKLTDLGIARWAEVTQTGSAQLAGTAGYVAPEVADGAAADAASDVFSLGATLFAAVEGHSPWGDGDRGPMAQFRRAARFQLEPTRKADALAPALRALMSRRPADRPTAAVARDLLADQTTAPTEPIRRRLRLAARPRQLAVASAALAIVLVAAVVVVTLVNGQSTGAEDAADQPVPAGSLGEPRTADPCSLLEPQSLARFGKVALEPEYGNFNHCDLIALIDNDGVLDVSTEFDMPDVDPARPPTRGRLNGIERFEKDGDHCVRSITLPNLYRVMINARFAVEPSGELPDLCGMADATATDVLSALTRGPIPRRPVAFAPESTARLDACRLLTPAEVAPIVHSDVVVDPEFANWSCYFDGDDRAVQVKFGREYPLEPGEDEAGVQIDVQDRRGFVDEDDGGCTVAIVHRAYPIESPALGSPHTREEIVEVTVEENDGTTDDVAARCAEATLLAGEVAGRLPKVS